MAMVVGSMACGDADDDSCSGAALPSARIGITNTTTVTAGVDILFECNGDPDTG